MLQDARTSDLIFTIPVLISYITASITLEPGDLILTGTPEGVGVFREPKVRCRTETWSRSRSKASESCETRCGRKPEPGEDAFSDPAALREPAEAACT